MARVTVAALADIPADGMRGFVVGERMVAVYRCGEQLYATENMCSHAEAELTDGWLDPDDCTVECPLHGARFNLADGAALTLPAFKPIPVYPVTVEDGQVVVELPDA